MSADLVVRFASETLTLRMGESTSAALESAALAAAGADLAEAWAIGSAPGGPGTKSAKDWAESVSYQRMTSREQLDGSEVYREAALNGGILASHQLSIASGQTGAGSFVGAYRAVSAETAALLVGTRLRLTATFTATANFKAQKPTAGFYGTVVRGGAAINLDPGNATLISDVQVGTLLTRVIEFDVGATDTAWGVGYQVDPSAVANAAHTIAPTSMVWEVIEVAAASSAVAPGSLTARAQTGEDIDDAVLDLEFSSGAGLADADTGATTAAGGATLIVSSATGQTVGWSIAAGQSGFASGYYALLPIDGVATDGLRVQVTLEVDVSETFTRDLLVVMQVQTGINSFLTRDALPTTVTTVGSKRIYLINYDMQGDEIGLRPAIVQTSNTNAASTETLSVSSLELRWVTSHPRTSVADANIAQLRRIIRSETSAFARSIADAPLGYAETVTVKTVGGHFTHPKLALDAIKDASPYKRYKIEVYPGEYDDYAEWHTKDWVDLIGIGRREDIIISYANPDATADGVIGTTSTFWLDSTTKIEGLTITVENGRYAIHRETDGSRPGCFSQIVNCHVEHLGNPSPNNTWVSQAGVGAGLSQGERYRDRGSVFIGPDGGFSYHLPGVGGYDDPTFVDLEGCEFIATLPGIPDLWVKPICAGAGDSLRLVGNTLGLLAYKDDGFVSAPADLNTAQIAIYGHGNTAFTFDNRIQYGSAAGASYVPLITGAGGAVTVA